MPIKFSNYLLLLVALLFCCQFTQTSAQSSTREIIILDDIDKDSLIDTLLYQSDSKGNRRDSLIRIVNTRQLVLELALNCIFDSGYFSFWSIYELPHWFWEIDRKYGELLIKQFFRTESSPQKVYEFHPGAEWTISLFEDLLFTLNDSSQFEVVYHVKPKWKQGTFKEINAVYYYIYESDGITNMLDAMDGSCAVRLGGPTKAIIEFTGTCSNSESYPQEVGKSGDYVVKKTPFGLFVEKKDSFYWLFHDDGFSTDRIPELLFPTINDVLVADGMAFWTINHDPFDMNDYGFSYYVADIQTGRVGSLKGLPQKKGYRFETADGQLILTTNAGEKDRTCDNFKFAINKLKRGLAKANDD